MKEKLCEFDPQIGFCHNDLSHANLIYTPEEGEGWGLGGRC